MPCPAKELAGIELFVAIFKIECGGKTTSRCGVMFAAIGLGHTQECLCYWESSANWSWRKLVRSL
jgi:hypothetical protein